MLHFVRLWRHPNLRGKVKGSNFEGSNFDLVWAMYGWFGVGGVRRWTWQKSADSRIDHSSRCKILRQNADISGCQRIHLFGGGCGDFKAKVFINWTTYARYPKVLISIFDVWISGFHYQISGPLTNRFVNMRMSADSYGRRLRTSLAIHRQFHTLS